MGIEAEGGGGLKGRAGFWCDGDPIQTSFFGVQSDSPC